MLDFEAVRDWIWQHHRVLGALIVGLAAGCGAAYLVAEVLGRLDRGGRQPVGRLITAVAALVVATLASVTIATIPFANTAGTRIDALPRPDPNAPMLAQIARALHPADYAYASAMLILAVGAGLWAVRRRSSEAPHGDPATSQLLIGASVLLLITLWIFQRGVGQLQPETGSAPQFFGTIAGAGVLAMALIQGLRSLLPLRGAFHRVALERWIDAGVSGKSSDAKHRRRILDSITGLARGPVPADQYDMLDLPIEQLCGQIAAGADRLLDAPFAATLEGGESESTPATVKEVLAALAPGGRKDIDEYLRLARSIHLDKTETTGQEPDDTGPPGARAEQADSGAAAAVAPAALSPVPTALSPVPDVASAVSDSAQRYIRLRTGISHRIQRNIDGLQISTTFWWRRAVRSLAFTVSGALGLSLFEGRITYTVMCAIVGGFVASAARDLVAVIEKARR